MFFEANNPCSLDFSLLFLFAKYYSKKKEIISETKLHVLRFI